MSDFGMVSVPQCCTPLTGVGSERVLFSGPIPQSLSAPFNRSRGFPPREFRSRQTPSAVALAVS